MSNHRTALFEFTLQKTQTILPLTMARDRRHLQLSRTLVMLRKEETDLSLRGRA